MQTTIAPTLLAELAKAKADREQRLGPATWTYPRYPVWQRAYGQDRRTFLRSRCGRPRAELREV